MCIYTGGVPMLMCSYPMPVRVREYKRFRYGRWEIVCSHCRSLPNG
ncbi:hypothetical protein ALT717_370011 [Alteromonas macleodii]